MAWVEGIGRSALAAAMLLALPALAEEPKPANDLSEIAVQIEQAAEGKSLLGPTVAPAEALDAKASKPERIAATNKRMIAEIDQVVGAFRSAPDGSKEQMARAVVHKLDIQTAADGASRVFEGDGPSQSIMRQFLVLPAASLGPDPVGRATDIVTSFEHSPKTDDNYYEYSNPQDFAGSTIRDLPGGSSSWNIAAQPSLAPGQTMALKKCRRVPILGWYCNTAVYGRVVLEGGETQLLVSTLRPVAKGSDNAKFTDDRAKNTADGSTALYVITRSGPSVLIYNLGFQTTRSAPSLQSKLNEGHKLEYRQLVQRFAMDGVR